MAERYKEHLAVDAQLLDSRSTQSVIVVAGKVGSGKSTALNNIFGLNFEARSSPTSVTKILTERRIQFNGVDTRVLDTPGCGGIDVSTVSTKNVIQDIAKAVKGFDFTLLYCLAVKPSDTLTETDKAIIKTLQNYLGRNVWDKCVLLLTFSDVALNTESSSDYQSDGYISFLHGHIQAFEDILKESGASVTQVWATFDHNMLQQKPPSNSLEKIIAVAVMKDRESGGTSGVISDWKGQAYSAISKVHRLNRRKNRSRRGGLLQFLWQNPRHVRQHMKENPVVLAVGTLLGASAGGLIGWLFKDDYGMFLGSDNGMFFGSFVGAFIGLVLTVLISIIIAEQ